jgi:hypothetical protein
MVWACLDVSRLSRRFAPWWMRLARVVASASVCLSCVCRGEGGLRLFGCLLDRPVAVGSGGDGHLPGLGPRWRWRALPVPGPRSACRWPARGFRPGAGRLPLGRLAQRAGLVLGAGPLGLGVLVGELEDLPGSLADRLARRPVTPGLRAADSSMRNRSSSASERVSRSSSSRIWLRDLAATRPPARGCIPASAPDDPPLCQTRVRHGMYELF